MFYSQFILAKKGPLGTIWIAAHLERKLRKNQVADTDIGVSVDSILFPEVPIALRLSSHLLLGVVRIYSRKVNYLFDDCSEALLKIKQAFRSTAVDLPPEESTAPYHSITLPETFDLDDFELPDNDMFQGNYVDHHVSTREQITLQDTMEGVVYSTSQFGLDERFGDGDTSQVDLDLEQDLFLDNVAATGHVEVSQNDVQTSVVPMPHLETDSHEKLSGFSEDMPLDGTRRKIEGLAANLEAIDYAQAPSTPGLVEEPNLSSVKEGLACDDHLESEDHNISELVGKESSENAPSKSDFHNKDDAMHLSLGDHLNHDSIIFTLAEENSCLSGDLEINQAGLEGGLLSTSVTRERILKDATVGALDNLAQLEDTNKGFPCSNEQTLSSVGQINGEYEESIGVGLQETDGIEIGNTMEESLPNGKAAVSISNTVHSLESPTAMESVNIKSQGCGGLEDPETLNDHVDDEEMEPACKGVLWACNSHLSQPDMSSHEVGNPVVTPDLQSADVPKSLETHEREEGFHPSGTSTKVQGQEYHVSDDVQSEEKWISEPPLSGEIQKDGGKEDEQPDNAIANDNRCENLNSSVASDLPACEKLLSVPQVIVGRPHDLLVEIPDKEVREEVDGSCTVTKFSGKKRSFAESSLTVQSLNSVESFGLTRLKRTVDSIPDDDDLLSSILVGRRSSVLKMKPSPPAPEVASMKRARSASRPSSLKRKVLMDDSMVLHGDTIRQQLTNTDDIRRLRKKAPCTRTEILIIQRQFLEEEIFVEPVLTGMSAELTHLHSETFDLSGIRISENDNNNHNNKNNYNYNASVEAVNDEDYAKQIVTQDNEIEEASEPVNCRNDTDGQPPDLPIHNGNHHDEEHLGSDNIDNQECMHGAAVANCTTSDHEHLGEMSEMEIDKVNAEVADATYQSVPGLETSQSEPVPGDISEMPTGIVDQSAFADKTTVVDDVMQMDMHTSDLPSDKIDTQLTEEGDRERDGVKVVDHCVEKIDAVQTELAAGKGILFDESKVGASFEIRADSQVDGFAPTDDGDISLVNVSSETGECINLSPVNIDQALDDVECDKPGVRREDGDQAVSSGCIDDKDQTTNHFCSEDSKMDSLYPVGLDGDFKSASINGDYAICKQADHQSTTDTQNAPPDHVNTEDFSGFQDVAFANDTEFLNVDDDEVGEDDEEGMPNSEDTRLLENSGWSSRTRAVAKYLQTLFEKEAEAGYGRKVLAMENLLAGKTRKEASRMFFETLVLKTRDYVHVEQTKPFDNISIRPRAKLMKSDF